jgi:hypothetical protein
MSTEFANSPTPYRKTHIWIDDPEFVLGTPIFSMNRSKKEIGYNPEGTAVSDILPAGTPPSSNVQILDSGAWTLTCLNDRTTYIHERTDNYGAVLRASAWQLAPTVGEVPRWRNPTELFGLVSAPQVADSGDIFLIKQPTTNWDLTLAADIASYGQPNLPTSNFDMDRIGVGNMLYQADQGFLLRWSVPGTYLHTPDNILTFYFGGPAQSNGQGQFCLTMYGDGFCELFELIQTDPIGDPGFYAWTSRDKWRYCEPHFISDTSHSMRIFPHVTASGNGSIEFRSGSGDHNSPGASSNVTGKYNSGESGRAHSYQVTFPFGSMRTHCTGPGYVRYDVRRDLRAYVQVSTLQFFPTGLLVDKPFEVPFSGTGLVESGGDLVMVWNSQEPDSSSVVGTLWHALTGIPLTLTSSGDGYATFTPSAGIYGGISPFYFAQFAFNADVYTGAAPKLHSYRVYNNAVYTTTTTTPFEIIHPAGEKHSISITGGEADPSHETAAFVIEDTSGQRVYPFQLRARQNVRIETEYDPSDDMKRSILFQGNLIRGTGHKKGTVHDAAFPSINFYGYDFACTGKWIRLQEAVFYSRISLNDPLASAAAGKPVQYKVTDFLRSAISWAGYPDSMIDVPDSAIRFTPLSSTDENNSVIEPFVKIMEFCVKAARDYLGWFWVWDANCSVPTADPPTVGMWRCRPPNTAPYTNLATFYTFGESGKLTQYIPSRNDPPYAGYPQAGEIEGGTFNGYIRPPESTAVVVTGTGNILESARGQAKVTNWLINPDLNNPASADMTGNFAPLAIVDLSIGPGCDSETAQNFINMLARREYDYACHAVPCAYFDGPLLLVTDPNDNFSAPGSCFQFSTDENVGPAIYNNASPQPAYTVVQNPRPLRYYDAVGTMDAQGNAAQWLVRNCNPEIKIDGHQHANYELEQPTF